jgi:hypothetical protein
MGKRSGLRIFIMVMRLFHAAFPILVAFVLYCSKIENLSVLQKQESLEGTVFSGITLQPLPDVEIKFGNLNVTSDSSGHFEIRVPDATVDMEKDAICFSYFPFKTKNVHIDEFIKHTHSDSIILELPGQLSAYRELIKTSVDQGYKIVPVIEWYRDFADLHKQKVIILRHDVDVGSQTAMALGYIENQFQAGSTFYFRWSTADGAQINYLRKIGHEIGLHYETLAAYCIENKISKNRDVTDDVIKTCREALKAEISSFEMKFGDIFSICSHGTIRNRLVGIPNSILMSGQTMADFFIETDANAAEITRSMDIMIADSGDHWDPISYEQALKNNYQIMYILIHPDWWGDMKIAPNMN